MTGCQENEYCSKVLNSSLKITIWSLIADGHFPAGPLWHRFSVLTGLCADVGARLGFVGFIGYEFEGSLQLVV